MQQSGYVSESVVMAGARAGCRGHAHASTGPRREAHRTLGSEQCGNGQNGQNRMAMRMSSVWKPEEPL